MGKFIFLGIRRLSLGFILALTVVTQTWAYPAVTLDIEIQSNPPVKGQVVLELYPAKAPITVENFLTYVKSGFYDGTIFHRVIDGFMVQGGGFDENMAEKQTRAPILNEAKNGLQNKVGTIAMARTNNINSATAQFFINVADNDFLNYRSEAQYGYAVFGKVISGMEIVNQMKSVPTGRVGYFEDVPAVKIVIRKASQTKN